MLITSCSSLSTVNPKSVSSLVGRRKTEDGALSSSVSRPPSTKLDRTCDSLHLARLREPVAIGVGHQLEAIGDAQLGEDRGEMVDDSRLADRQALADLPIFQALAN